MLQFYNHVRLFQKIDENGDGFLSSTELRALIIGIRFEDIDLDKDDAVEKVMNDFDTSQDSHVDMGEFVAGISKWIDEAKLLGNIASAADPGSRSIKLLRDFHVVSFCSSKPRYYIQQCSFDNGFCKTVV